MNKPEFTRSCFDCAHCDGSADEIGKILCNSRENALERARIDEWEEEKNIDMISPAYWGLTCFVFSERR